MTIEELRAWNDKLYPYVKDPNGTKSWETVSQSHGDEWFWEKFGLESWPKFENKCSYHVPKLWEDAVMWLVYDIQYRFGKEIEFFQIKEKFIELVVYYRTYNKTYDEQIRFMIQETRDNLRIQGLHV